MERPMEAMMILAKYDAVGGLSGPLGLGGGQRGFSVHIHFDSRCVLVGIMDRAEVFVVCEFEV